MLFRLSHHFGFIVYFRPQKNQLKGQKVGSRGKKTLVLRVRAEFFFFERVNRSWCLVFGGVWCWFHHTPNTNTKPHKKNQPFWVGVWCLVFVHQTPNTNPPP